MLSLRAAFLLAVCSHAASADWLIAGPLERGSRLPLNADSGLEKFAGVTDPAAPKAGDALGPAKWEAATPDADGLIESGKLNGGCAYTCVSSASDRVAVAAVRGASSFFVNGEPFVGDVYDQGFVRIPVPLRKGDNHIYLRVSRGRVAFRVEDPPASLYLIEKDATLPDRVGGVPAGKWGAIPIANATLETVRDATLEYGNVRAPLPPLPPLTVLKMPFLVGKGPSVRVRVVRGENRHEVELTLRERKPGESYARTFRSEIDRSVQFFGVLPPANFSSSKTYALVLSLHGAGVGADGQAAAYTARDWCAVVAPTNRRGFGFDWEEWGRMDALEVLAEAHKLFKVDASRTYLTGHSMGGHGTWQLGVQYPDRWAAIAPSAGWISFWTYPPQAKMTDDPAVVLFRRAANPSDTLALGRNLAGLPVFMIHGDKDDNVPIDQAHRMVEYLKEFHDDFHLHTEAGAGHWWDGPEPGADCVNLSKMFDFLQRRRRPDTLDRWEFRTASPAVSSRFRDVEILAQQEPLGYSRIAYEHRRIDGESTDVVTENVAHLRLRAPGRVTLDGAHFPKDGEFHRAADGAWTAGAPKGLLKSPALQGPFTQAFHRPFLLVYGTGGDAAETRALLALARFHAELWWYRGNGRARVVADADVAEEDWKKYNLALYGNAASNACWKKIAEALPVKAAPGELVVGGDSWKGEFAVLAVHPNPAAEGRLVALVGETGPAGRRALYGTSWFQSGTMIPDVVAWDADAFTKGMGAVRAAGWFGADWKPLPSLWTVRK